MVNFSQHVPSFQSQVVIIEDSEILIKQFFISQEFIENLSVIFNENVGGKYSDDLFPNLLIKMLGKLNLTEKPSRKSLKPMEVFSLLLICVHILRYLFYS